MISIQFMLFTSRPNPPAVAGLFPDLVGLSLADFHPILSNPNTSGIICVNDNARLHVQQH